MATLGARLSSSRNELRTPFRLLVGAEVERLRRGRKRVPKGEIEDLARRFKISRRTVFRLAKEFRDGISRSEGIDCHRQRRGNCGRAKVPTMLVENKIRAISPCKRHTIRDMSESAGIAQSTFFRKLGELGARRHTRWVKPCLSAAQKEARLRWIVDRTIRCGRNFEFKNFCHTLHLDEKWFEAVRDGQKVWVLPDEGHIPAPKVQHKSFVKKIMFLAVVGRPHHRPDGTFFNGLVGVWPFAKRVFAQRASKNRARGTAELQPVTVTGDVWRDLMVEKVFPAVRSAMRHAKRTTVLQLDGAKVHFKRSIRADIDRELNRDGFAIKLEQQPSNSPDLNVLDLGFFHSLQRKVAKIKHGGNLVDIVENVQMAFESYPPATLENVWQSLVLGMNNILRAEGGNDFPLPHHAPCAAENGGELGWRVAPDRVAREMRFEF